MPEKVQKPSTLGDDENGYPWEGTEDARRLKELEPQIDKEKQRLDEELDGLAWQIKQLDPTGAMAERLKKLIDDSKPQKPEDRAQLLKKQTDHASLIKLDRLWSEQNKLMDGTTSGDYWRLLSERGKLAKQFAPQLLYEKVRALHVQLKWPHMFYNAAVFTKDVKDLYDEADSLYDDCPPAPNSEKLILTEAKKAVRVLYRFLANKLPTATLITPPTKSTKRRPGRPPDTDKTTDKRIYDAWMSGHHQTFAILGEKELSMTGPEVERAVRRHRKRLLPQIKKQHVKQN